MNELYLWLEPGWSQKIDLTDMRAWQQQNNIPADDINIRRAPRAGSEFGRTVLEFSRVEDMTAFRLKFGL